METLQNTDEYITLEASIRKYKANNNVGIELTGHTAHDNDVINPRRKEAASTGDAMLTFVLALPSTRFYLPNVCAQTLWGRQADDSALMETY